MRGEKGSWNFLKIRVLADLTEHLRKQCVSRGKANEQIRGSADSRGELDAYRSLGNKADECPSPQKENPGKFRAKDEKCVNQKWEVAKTVNSPLAYFAKTHIIICILESLKGEFIKYNRALIFNF